MTSVRVSTQVAVRVGGVLRQMDYIDPARVSRTLEVEFEFDQCDACGALTLPGNTSHQEWHRAKERAA